MSFYQLFMYENQKEGSVFTPSNLQSMCEFEKSFYDFKVGGLYSCAQKVGLQLG